MPPTDDLVEVRGWEAFGSVTVGSRPKNPTVQRIGATRLNPEPDDEDLEDFEPEELHGGVATIEQSSTGGRTGETFIKITGADRDDVEAAWWAIADAWSSGSYAWWWTP